MPRYGDIGEDGCPCGTYHDTNVLVVTHCWRTSMQNKGKGHCSCEYCGVHYKIVGDTISALSKVTAIAEYIKTAWATEVKVEEAPNITKEMVDGKNNWTKDDSAT